MRKLTKKDYRRDEMREPEQVDRAGERAYRFYYEDKKFIDISQTGWKYFQYRIEMSHNGIIYALNLEEANAAVSGLGYRALKESDFISGNE